MLIAALLTLGSAVWLVLYSGGIIGWLLAAGSLAASLILAGFGILMAGAAAIRSECLEALDKAATTG